MYIGRDTRITGVSYKGEFYSFRIYEKALTEAEVKQNYDNDKERFDF